LWETFLLQMDADEDEPLGRAPAGGEQTGATTTTTSEQQTGSHPTEENDQERRPDGSVATAADVALEQDA